MNEIAKNMQVLKGIWIGVIMLSGLIQDNAKAQNAVAILASPFKVVTVDSNYRSLERKIPALICSGILYKSNLHLVAEPGQGALLMRYLTNGMQDPMADSVRLKSYRRTLDSLHADYFMNGEVGISGDDFYVNINATDFSGGTMSYKTTKYYPLTDFQKILDEASENLNQQMRLRLSGGKSKKMLINPFYISFAKKVFGRNTVDNIYAPDFLSRYLAYNIKSTSSVTVLPYSISEQLRFYPEDERAMLLKPDFVISGNVLFSGYDSCQIQPVVYDNQNDSLALEPVRGTMKNKDELLIRTLSEIQSLANNIDTAINSIAQLKSLFLINGDYQRAFDLARKNRRYELALYYARQLARKSLLIAEIYYDQGNYKEALQALQEFTRTDSLNPEANYYFSLVYIKRGRYQLAKDYLSLLATTMYAVKDLHYQKGVCLYYQDSTDKALDEFKRALSIDVIRHIDMNMYIGSIYRNKRDWKHAEDAYLTFYRMDRASLISKTYLYDLYVTIAEARLNGKAYRKAGALYKQAYQYVPLEDALLGALSSFVQAHDEDSIQSIIQLASKDTVTDMGTFYLDASAFCRRQEADNEENHIFLLRMSVFFLTQYLKTPHSSLSEIAEDLGSDYFRLKQLDSAEYYYKMALHFNRDQPDNHFNLAELQIMKLNLSGAATTLYETRRQFHLDSVDIKGNPVVTSDYYTALYLVYYCQYGLMAHKDIKKYEARLKKIISRYKGRRSPDVLFAGWSFLAYHTWLTENDKQPYNVKRALIWNLCLILPYSNDKDLSCK